MLEARWRRAVISFLVVPLLSLTVIHAEIKKAILIAGNFSINGIQYNIAEFDPSIDSWRESFNSQVYLYSEESSGVVWDVVLNETDSFTDVFAAGLFDTDAKLSQEQLCSVAFYDSGDVEKIGEGLCSRGGDYGPIAIRSIVIGDKGDLFVGGSFTTRVWDRNRHKFVLVSQIARFDAASSSWLPLEGGGELVHDGADTARVNTLLWDSSAQALFLGGAFHMVDSTIITPNLAMWSSALGLVSFPGGSALSVEGDKPESFEIFNIFQENTTRTLIIVGSFTLLNKVPCFGIASWNSVLVEWRCLLDAQDMLLSIDAAAFNGHKIFLAGPLSPDTFDAKQFLTQYGVIYLTIDPLLDEYIERLHSLNINLNDSTSNNSTSNNHSSNNSNSNSNTAQNISSIKNYIHNNQHHIVHNDEMNHHRHHHHHHHHRRLRHSQPVKISKNTQNSNSNSHRRHIAPAIAPNTPYVPWLPSWNWLPQLPFLSRRITHLKAGVDIWQESLFLALEEDNLPSLLAWNFPPRKNGNGNITFIGGHHLAPYGVIHSIQIVTIPSPHPPTFNPALSPTSNNNHPGVVANNDYTYVVVISCIGIGLILGAGLICTCMGYHNFKYNYYNQEGNDLDHDGDNDEEDISAGGIEKSNIGPISLKTLTDGQTENVSLDFKECFERAMKTRHLPTYETLVIINPKEILLARIIGEGSFGRVWSGQWRNNAVAVKEFVFAQAAIAGGSLQRNNIIEEIVGEAGVMACLRHPKILQLYGCSLTMQAIWIVSELCLLGSLKMLLMNPKVELPVLKRLSMLLDIADGMQYLHQRSPPIIHRDLKSHNIFIQETFPGHYVAKIGDWGSARAIALTGAKSMTQGVGTACWLSPEVINNAHFSKSSDVYAFGIILWEVYTRQEIYEGLSAAQIIAKVAHEGLRPHVPRECPWSSIMTKCWRQDPAARPNFETILSALGRNFLKLTDKYNNQQQQQQQSTSLNNKNNSPAAQASLEMSPLSPPPPLLPSVDPAAATTNTLHDSMNKTRGGTNNSINKNDSSSSSNTADKAYKGEEANEKTSLLAKHSSPSSSASRVAQMADMNYTENTTSTSRSGALSASASSSRSNSSSESAGSSSKKSNNNSSNNLISNSAQQHPLSPVKRSSRSNKFYDNFHPSLENIVTETKTPFSTTTSASRLLLPPIEESPAHLAPEIAQVEAQGLLLGTTTNNSNATNTNTYSHGISGKSGSGSNVSLISSSSAEEESLEDADPIDFLFDSHRKARAILASLRKKK